MEIVRRKADCCGVMSEQTYMKDGQDLAFCQHHANEHNVILMAEGWTRLIKSTETIDTAVLVPVE